MIALLYYLLTSLLTVVHLSKGAEVLDLIFCGLTAIKGVVQSSEGYKALFYNCMHADSGQYALFVTASIV